MDDRQNQFRNMGGRPSINRRPMTSVNNYNQPVNNNGGVYSSNVPTDPNYPNPTPVPSGDIVLQPDRKKGHKGLIISLICAVAVLLIGGGAFAAVYIINNQPERIALSAINNLISANRVEIDGSVNFSLANSEAVGIEAINLKFDDQQTSGISNSATATLSVDFTNGNRTAAVNLGEVMLSDGVFYLEADGLKDFYYNAFYDNAMSSIISQLESNYRYSLVTDCYSNSEVTDCYSFYDANITPEVATTIKDAATDILNRIGQIVESLDGQWIEFSVQDAMKSDMLSFVDDSTRKNIADTYKCTVDKLSQMSNYSSEFSSLYSQNPFVTLTATTESFYNVGFDATKLANYLNSMPQTQFAQDLAACFNTTLPSAGESNITTASVNSMLEYIPQISAKFDGFFTHHLTALQINEQNNYYTLSSNLNFSYPSSFDISAPTDTRPIMEVVQEVYDRINGLQDTLYSF